MSQAIKSAQFLKVEFGSSSKRLYHSSIPFIAYLTDKEDTGISKRTPFRLNGRKKVDNYTKDTDLASSLMQDTVALLENTRIISNFLKPFKQYEDKQLNIEFVTTNPIELKYSNELITLANEAVNQVKTQTTTN